MSLTLNEHTEAEAIVLHIIKKDVERVIGRTVSDDDWKDYVNGIGLDHAWEAVNWLVEEVGYDFDEEFPEDQP